MQRRDLLKHLAAAPLALGAGRLIAWSTVGTDVRRRSSHHPKPASAPPIVGPHACLIRLEPDTPSSMLPKL